MYAYEYLIMSVDVCVAAANDRVDLIGQTVQ